MNARMPPTMAMSARSGFRRSASKPEGSHKASASAPRKARNAKPLNNSRIQEPNEIGDQYFKIGSPRWSWKSMCQKRSGRSRSAAHHALRVAAEPRLQDLPDRRRLPHFQVD